MSGAWDSDFGGHADEGAHVVTSLMVRDYLGGGFLSQPHPIRYAEACYDQFPKVAIGHYPPVFYGFASIFLLPFRSPGALLLCMAVTAAGSGAMMAFLAGKILEGRISSWAVAIAWCLHPLVRTYTAIVMSDLLLVFFCLAALAAFARFRENRALSASLAFGLLSALAILTKGYGIVLALVPVFSIILARDWELIRNPRLWVSAIVVAVLAFPWMWLTREITAEGMSEAGVVAHLASAIPYYLRALPVEFGWFLSLVLLWGAVLFLSRLIRSKSAKRENPDANSYLVSIVSFLVSCLLCILIVPAGLDHRYLLPLLSASLLVSGWGIQQLFLRKWPRFRRVSVVFLGLILLLETYRLVEKQYTGARESIASVLSASFPEGPRHLLVVSNAAGEGALISAAVFQGAESLRVSRGSQFLAESDWLGRGYTLTFDDADGLRSLLLKEGIDFVVYDEPVSGGRAASHWKKFPDHFLSPILRREVQEIAIHESLRKHGRKTAFRLYRISRMENEAETAP